MGKIDARTYEYMSNNSRFADIFNYYLYDGNKVIKPENLHELDTRELAMPYGEEKVADTIQRYRDILKYMSAKTDDKAAYLLLGIENQADNHYAMPVKNMLYDAAQYARQVTVTARSHRRISRKEEAEKLKNGEYLSGFYRDDKLLPVITLVIFWSPDEWDAPTSLHEMLAVEDESILRFISDYKINLVTPYRMQDEDFDKLGTTLSEALKYIKHSKDKVSLQKILENDKVYQSIDRETAELIKDVVGSEMDYEGEGEVVNMCLAEQEMKKDAADDRAKEIAMVLINMGKITIEEIAQATKLSLEDVQKLASNTVK